MSESRLGVPARIMFAHAERGRGLVPERVEHLQLGITWEVTGILDSWQHRGSQLLRAGLTVTVLPPRSISRAAAGKVRA